MLLLFLFFFQAEDGIRDGHVTGVQTCALPILASESLILTVSMNSSSSSWSSPSTSPNARKRWITSSVNPGVVKILVRYMSSSAEGPVRSEERRVGRHAGGHGVAGRDGRSEERGAGEMRGGG